MTMTKDNIINNILFKMHDKIDNSMLVELKNCLVTTLYNYEIVEQTTTLSVYEEDDTEKYLRLFAIEKKIEGLAIRSIEHYINESRKMFDFIGKNFRDITKEDITYYLAHLTTTKNLSSTTLDNTRKYIKAFFNWLVYNDHLIKNPFNKIKCIRREPVKKEILSEHELEKLRDACVDKRELALIDFLNCTGVRVSEASNIKVDDIDFVTGKCNIYAKKTKTWRIGFLDAKALKHLTDYRLELSDKSIYPEYLFVSKKGKHKLKESSIQNVLKNVKKRAGIDRDVSVHTFRKTFASRLYRKGLPPMSIALLLGHKDFSTTAKYYIQIDKDGLKFEYDRCMN